MTPAKQAAGLELLRQPFPPNQINTLPKPYNKESPKGNCRECGGYHGLPAVHLSYVGHAALTDRFLDADPNWSWEPLALGPDGLPAMDKLGGMWIRLTICGVTRLGYGDAQGKTGTNAIKETIGDALRNAGMRFGAALDLWHKGDLHDDEQSPTPAPAPIAHPVADAAVLGALKAATEQLTPEQSAELVRMWREQHLPKLEQLSPVDAEVAMALLEDARKITVEEPPLWPTNEA